VFPKCRNSRRSEHCQGGGGGRRGHYLDKRSGAVQCQRQTRSPNMVAVQKSVRLHAFHAALVVDGCGIFAVPVVGSCGILAANIVGACGNGRGWLRRSCGKISSKPAASVVDQPLTDVRGKASPLFLWVPSECAHTTNHALFLPLGVGCWLRRMRAGIFVAGCWCCASLAESVAYALSGSARPHCGTLPRHDPQSISPC